MQAHPKRRQAIVGAVGVGAQCRSPWRTQGGRSTKTCRDKRGRKGDWDVPFRILSVTTHLLKGSKSGIQPQHAGKLRIQLTALEHATSPKDMNAPGWRLHRLSGDLAGFYSVSMQAAYDLWEARQRPRPKVRRIAA